MQNAVQNMEESAPDGAVGQRVAVQRKLAGLTQYQLADRAHVSRSLVSQVERGMVPASPAFTAAVARALRIDVDTLYGQPPPADPRADHAGIPALRIALGRDLHPDLDAAPMTAAELRTRLDECEAHRGKARYATVLTALPELLNHAYALVADAPAGSPADTAWALLDDAYTLAEAVSHRFGYWDLGALAARCGREAAARAGDPLRAAVDTLRASHVSLHQGDLTGVLLGIDHGHALIDGAGSPTARAVSAQLHLRQAIAHARLGALDRADEYIDEARHLTNAPEVPARPYFVVNASPANVEIHWVAAPVELCDGTTAVGRADATQLPADAEPSRVGHHWIDVARAWTLHGNRTQALDALHQARRITPQQTRYHPQVHETVRILAETDRRATDTLAGFARWLGVHL